MKEIIKSILSKKFINKLAEIKHEYFDRFVVKSYSQEGEDMILRRIFEKQKKGFYVDVGAHHPKRFSNTFFFYKKGWRGINIDAMPGSMKKFDRVRPRDINIERPISDKKEFLTYYSFNETALNGFSKVLSEDRDGKGDYFLEFTKEIETETLEKILDKYLPKDQAIDFLSIDVEGLDFQVLKSNDFDKYKPKVVLIEMLGNRMEDIQSSEISNHLNQSDYLIFGKTVNTVIFISKEFYNERFTKKQ